MPARSLPLAQQLLSFDTINPPGNEQACVQFLAAWLQEQGFVVELTGFGEQRANLIARLGPDAGQTAGLYRPSGHRAAG